MTDETATPFKICCEMFEDLCSHCWDFGNFEEFIAYNDLVSLLSFYLGNGLTGSTVKIKPVINEALSLLPRACGI